MCRVAVAAASAKALRELAGGQVPGEELGECVALPVRQS
jgi:hypothetical protein